MARVPAIPLGTLFERSLSTPSADATNYARSSIGVLADEYERVLFACGDSASLTMRTPEGIVARDLFERYVDTEPSHLIPLRRGLGDSAFQAYLYYAAWTAARDLAADGSDTPRAFAEARLLSRSPRGCASARSRSGSPTALPGGRVSRGAQLTADAPVAERFMAGFEQWAAHLEACSAEARRNGQEPGTSLDNNDVDGSPRATRHFLIRELAKWARVCALDLITAIPPRTRSSGELGGAVAAGSY